MNPTNLSLNSPIQMFIFSQWEREALPFTGLVAAIIH